MNKSGNQIPGMGLRIKKAREEKGYNQTELADIVGVKPAAISQYESGSRIPSTQVLIKLADVLEVTTEFLLGKKKDLDIEDMLKMDIEGILSNDSVRALFRDYKNLSERDKNTILSLIKSLKSGREEE